MSQTSAELHLVENFTIAAKLPTNDLCKKMKYKGLLAGRVAPLQPQDAALCAWKVRMLSKGPHDAGTALPPSPGVSNGAGTTTLPVLGAIMIKSGQGLSSYWRAGFPSGFGGIDKAIFMVVFCCSSDSAAGKRKDSLLLEKLMSKKLAWGIHLQRD